MGNCNCNNDQQTTQIKGDHTQPQQSIETGELPQIPTQNQNNLSIQNHTQGKKSIQFLIQKAQQDGLVDIQSQNSYSLFSKQSQSQNEKVPTQFYTAPTQTKSQQKIRKMDLRKPSFLPGMKETKKRNSLIQLKQRIHMGVIQKLLKNYQRIDDGYNRKLYQQKKVDIGKSRSQIIQLDQKFMLDYDIQDGFEQNAFDRQDRSRQNISPTKRTLQRYITVVHFDDSKHGKINKDQFKKSNFLGLPTQQQLKKRKYRKADSIISVKKVKKISSQVYQNLEGQMIENFYETGDLIKKTEFGEYYKAINKTTKKQRLLIKVNYQNAKKKLIKQFLTQSIILNKIDHPYVIKLCEKIEEQNCLYLIMEYFNGQDLFEKVIKEKHLSECLAAIYFKQILSILKYFHQKNLVHRDLRLEIFQLANENELSNIKMVDLLNMRFLPKSGYLTNLKGSPYYIAPEVLNKKYNQKCDLWSAGIILYIMLMGKPPIKGSDNEILKKLKMQPDVLKGNDISHLSDDCQDLLISLLEVDPAKRISATNALEHPWISNNNIDEPLNKQALINMANYKVNNKLDGAILNFICNQLVSETEKYKISKIFKTIDKSNNGQISYTDLMQVYTDIYKDKIRAEKVVNSIIDNLGVQGEQSMNYSQIITATSNKMQLINKKNITQVFNIFDRDQNGHISLSEINSALGGNQMFNDLWNQIFIDKGRPQENEMKLSEFVDYIYKQVIFQKKS